MAGDVSYLSGEDTELLHRVCVRPICAEERTGWDALVDQYHYLGLRALFGKTPRYAAVADERWLALLWWQAAALKCAARDAWIGWPRVLHYQRLHLLANYARFLILPEARVPNLASRVLALDLRWRSEDWQRIHSHCLLLAETFVDATRFTGACYRAANRQVLGSTRGFARHDGRYTAHGQPKQVLVYPVHRRARALLCAPLPPPIWSAPMQRVSLSSAQMEDLHQRRLRTLPDCRHARGERHRQATVLTIAIAIAIAEWAARLTQKRTRRLLQIFLNAGSVAQVGCGFFAPWTCVSPFRYHRPKI